ncbi:hypothetical protein psal_cds_358 [Pandoravirus salinus]|uniref:DUF5898 domain-containing protein n=1 Tax=Pandoravirus salinus TaxID=1349410 RepID=A0A291ATI9_9VIRU|nr:hypothetical protein psal_cds_358 [Pandoravirus salinus]ATE82164.1 hypothetical protein psal_cds_358 [Pandoravirus salinus]
MSETQETPEIGALLARLTPEQRTGLAKAIGSTSVGLLGLPPMARHARHRRHRAPSAAVPPTTTQTAASVMLRSFIADERVPLCQMHRSGMWALAERDDCSKSMSARDLVLQALYDIRNDTGLRADMGFWTQGRDLFRGRSDLFFPFCVGAIGGDDHFSGAVIARGEAKNKDLDTLDNARMHTDVFDVLCMIKAYHGATAPMAIVSTYARWRLFWLDDAYSACTLDGETPTLGPATIAGNLLCGTAPYDCCDPRLVRVIATALHRMHAQPTSKPPAPDLAAHVGTSTARVAWERSAPETTTLRRVGDSWGPPTATDFVLIGDLGAGADGRAWKARPYTRDGVGSSSSPKGTANIGDVDGHTADLIDVVIKFGHEGADVEPGDGDDLQSGGCLWREALVWRRVWGVTTARTTTLCGRPALVMPFARPVAASTDEANRVGAIDAVLQAVERMAAAGLCHDDLHWRHVGIIAQRQCGDATVVNGAAQNMADMVVFFDLARVSRRRPERASARMKAALGLCSDDSGDGADSDASGGGTESSGSDDSSTGDSGPSDQGDDPQAMCQKADS